MKHTSKFLFVFLALGLLFACAQAPQQLVSEKPAAPVVDLASEKIRDSIVLIEDENTSGTGFFVAPDKIATNIYSVAHAGAVSVKSADEEKDWTIEGVVGFDAENGLVILKLTGEGTPLPLADSDRVEVGESVSILSYPDGAFKVLESRIQSLRKRNRWLRLNTTAAKKTNGSPVFNNNGQVFGVIVPYWGYAISVGMLEALLDTSMPMEPLSEWQQREQIRAAAYYSLGKEKSKVEDYAGAIVEFDKAIKLNPKYLRAYYGRGRAQSELGDHDSATASLTQVLEMDSDKADAYYIRGSIKARRGDYAEAIVDLDKAIELDAQYADAYSNRGGIKFLLGKSEEANGNSEKAQSLYEASIADCDKAIEIDPEYANTYNFRGSVKSVLDDFEAAILDFNRAIERDPEDAKVYNNLGLAKLRLGESKTAGGNTKEAKRLYETAIADYIQAIEINPEYAKAYKNRATVKCKLGDIESMRGNAEQAQRLYHEGMTDYDKSIQLNTPEDVDESAADLASKKVKDSTVRVMSWVSNFYSGSGFFLDRDRIATNIHVVAQPGPVFAKLRDKEVIYAVEEVAAFDVENDLVVLKIAGEGTPLSVGDSEAVQEGEPVVVVGYPNKKYRVMKGKIQSTSNSGEWLRMNPNIGSGGSGSPMLNGGGQVVGIHAAGNEHYGYAIPSKTLKVLLAQSKPMEPLMEWQKREFIRAYALFVRGQMKYNANSYHEAIADFDKAIEINAQFFYPYHKRGDAKFALGNHEAAIADYDKAIKINDGIFNIYFDRGLAKSKFGDNKAAIADYDKAIVIDPEHATAYHRRGLAKLRLRDFEAAILDFNKDIKINPEHTDAYKKRAHAKFKLAESKAAQGDITGTLQFYQSAMEDCTQAIWLSPKDADAYDNRGWARFHLGESEAARGNMKKAADLYEKAIEDYTQAIKINPEHPYAYRNRANAKEALEKNEAARADFEKAKEITPDVER